LPKQFLFHVNEVEILRRGNEIVLREPKRNLGRAFAALAAMPNDFMSHGRQDRPPQKRSPQKRSPSQPKVHAVRVHIPSRRKRNRSLWGSCKDDRNTSSGEIRLQILFDGGWVDILAAIEPLQDFVHDLLGLVALAV